MELKKQEQIKKFPKISNLQFETIDNFEKQIPINKIINNKKIIWIKTN